MKKNLLFLHLESVSRAALWQYRCELDTVWRLMSDSYRINRFFTNSTSTEMTVLDLRYGDSSPYDLCPTFGLRKNIFPRLDRYSRIDADIIQHDPDYRWMEFYCSPYIPSCDTINPLGSHISVHNPSVPFVCRRALQWIAQSKSENKPFAAYFWDDSSHLAYSSPYKEQEASAAGKLRTGYALVNASLTFLLDGLSKLGLLDNTIIIGFGDHGDEAWSHGLNRGYCHSIAPYASVCWTPLFIYDKGRLEPGDSDQIASTIDIKKTALGLLFPDRKAPEKRTPFEGIDLFREKRGLAYSQNMFALQKEYSDPERGMTKGYGVTDGAYRLVVSSGGDSLDDCGMGFYCDQSDPSNSLNLLRFFKLDREGKIRKFRPPADAVAKHFSAVFGPEQVKSVESAFHKLKPLLSEFVKEKEEYALREYHAITEAQLEELAKDSVRAEASLLGIVFSEDNFVKRYEWYMNFLSSTRSAFAGSQAQLFNDRAFITMRKKG